MVRFSAIVMTSKSERGRLYFGSKIFLTRDLSSSVSHLGELFSSDFLSIVIYPYGRAQY
mgnify:CR=1 FL=1